MTQTVQILLAACGTIIALGGLFFLLLGNRIGDLVTVVGRIDTRLSAVENKLGEVDKSVAVVISRLDQHDAEFRELKRGRD